MLSRRVDEIVAAPPPASLATGFPHVRLDPSLLLHPLERDIDDADGQVAPDPLLDVATHLRPPRAIAEPEEREQDDLFELAEQRRIVILNMFHDVKYMR